MRGLFRFIGWMVILTLTLPFLILALPVLLIWTCVRLCGDGFRRNHRELADETRLMQKIHGGMVRMDRRVEALETLLLKDSVSPRDGFDHDWVEPVSTRNAYASRH